MKRLLAPSLALATLFPLAGCSRPTTVTGHVVSGEINMIGVVDPADPRLKQPGIPGVEVSARGTAARSDHILADAKTDKTGDFTLRIDDREAISSPAEFRAHQPGFTDAHQESMYIPPADRRLLVILKPLGSGTPPK